MAEFLEQELSCCDGDTRDQLYRVPLGMSFDVGVLLTQPAF